MDLLVGVLAQAQHESNNEQLNCFYHNWDCFSGLGPLCGIGVATFLVFFIVNKRKGESEFETGFLAIKEKVASIFMETVILEAQLLIEVIADHLPSSITQASKAKPQTNRFDYFCQGIIDINKNKEESENLREDTSALLSNMLSTDFSNLLVEEARKLSQIIKMSTRLERTDYNSTGISYALEGDTALKFSFIAERIFNLNKQKKKYCFFQKLALMCLIVSLVSLVSFLGPLLINKHFCEIWGYSSILVAILFALFGILLWVRVNSIAGKLNTLSLNQEDFKSAYEKWKVKNKE